VVSQSALIELRFVVPPDRDGWRLDRFLRDRIPRLSRSRIQRIIEEEMVREGGPAYKPSSRVRVGDVIVLHRPVEPEPPAPTDFGVVFEDDALFVVDKPAGLAVHATARYCRHTLTWLLRERFGPSRPVIAHRLDRETSGLLVCARTREAERNVKQQFQDRTVTKEYLAVVRGSPSFDRDVIDIPLGPAQRSRVRIRMEPRNDALGQPARTECRVLERLRDCSLVLACPRTGRQHQIRAHLAAIGHPVIGDKIYGEDEQMFIDFVEHGLTTEDWERLELPRHALHAYCIELRHPTTGQPVVFESPLAADLEDYLDRKRNEAAGPRHERGFGDPSDI
jgi:23S rRNA pseudouridine1911/1915/1917 synthase